MKNAGELGFRKTGLGEGQKTESRTSRQPGDPGEEGGAMKSDMEAGPCPASLAPPLPLVAVWLRAAAGLSWYSRREGRHALFSSACDLNQILWIDVYLQAQNMAVKKASGLRI